MNQKVVILILSIICAGSFFIFREIERSVSTQQEQEVTREVAIGRNVKAKYFNENNKLSYKMVSATVKEYSNNKGTKFENPSVDAFSDDEQLLWTGGAENSHLTANKQKLSLNNNVYVTYLPNSENPTHFSGKKVVYFVDKGEVSGSGNIIINNKHSSQLAQSFKLNTKTEIVEFDGGVKATHQPSLEEH